MLRFLPLSPEVVILQFPIPLRIFGFPSFAISLLWKRLWLMYSFGCHLSQTKRGGGKHTLSTLFSLGALRFSSVFCGKSYHLSTKVASSGAEESWLKDIKYVLAEWRKGVKGVWSFGMGTVGWSEWYDLALWINSTAHWWGLRLFFSPLLLKRRTLHVDFQDFVL